MLTNGLKWLFCNGTEMGLDRPLHFNAVATAEDLLRHNFLPQRPTKVLSHGWNSEGKDFSDDFVAGKLLKT